MSDTAVSDTVLDLDVVDTEHRSVGMILLDAIEAIGKARGSKAKQELLRSYSTSMNSDDSWLLLQTLKYAYEPSIRFGIILDKIDNPVTQARSPKDFGAWVFTLLDEVVAETRPSVKKGLIEQQLGQMDIAGVSVLRMIIGRDLRCGISEGSIGKVFPSLLTKFDVMLAKPFLARHVNTWPVLVEPKLDGLRCIAEADTAAKTVTFYTRSGKTIDSLSNFKAEVLAFAHQFGENLTVAFDCEVTSGSFLESMSSVRSGSEQVAEGTLHVFDVLMRSSGHSPIALSNDELEEQGTQLQRRAKLVKGFTELKKHIPAPKFVELTGSYAAGSEEEIYVLYNRCRDANLEGVIIKDPNAFYVKKRSASWMKIKAQETLDLLIVGAFEGAGKYAGSLGGLIVMNEAVEVRVGSGFSDEQRVEYWEAIQQDTKRIEDGDRDKCRLIDCPAEIQYQELTPSGSLRHPVFVRLRRDKQLGSVGMF